MTENLDKNQKMPNNFFSRAVRGGCQKVHGILGVLTYKVAIVARLGPLAHFRKSTLKLTP